MGLGHTLTQVPMSQLECFCADAVQNTDTLVHQLIAEALMVALATVALHPLVHRGVRLYADRIQIRQVLA